MRSPIDYLKILRGKRIAVIAPHNDDEVIGCWFLMKELASLADLCVIVVTRHSNHPELSLRRRQETYAALAHIGISDIEHWDIPDGSAAAYESEIASLFCQRAIGWDYALCPAPNDRTPDHAVIAGKAHEILPTNKLIWYRSTWWTFSARSADFSVSGRFEDKAEALANFASQGHIGLRRGLTCSILENLLMGRIPKPSEHFLWARPEALAPAPLNSISLYHLPRLFFWR